MTRGPRRLKDDPDFRWETGCNLGDEESRVGGYDLAGLRSKLVAAAAIAPAPALGDGPPQARSAAPGKAAWRSMVKPAAGVVAGALVVAAAYWLGVQAGQDAPPGSSATGPASQHAPAPSVEPPPTSNVTPSAEPLGSADEAPIASPAPIRPPASARSGADADPAGTAEVVAAAPVQAEIQASVGEAEARGTADAGDAATGSATPPTMEASALKEYQEAYDLAKDALDDGRYADARAAFEQVERRWPGGYLAPELQMKLLQCDFGLGDDRATEAQAARIQEMPAFAARRPEIARLRAQALVRLNRCDEAMVVAGQASPRDAAEIRRACREERKETQ